MHAFGLGYGAGLAACLAGSLVRWALQVPPPADPATSVALVGLVSLSTTGFGWVLVVAPLQAVRDYDIRAAFRAADPRGWKSGGAGVVSGLAAVGGDAVLVHVVIEPSGRERDANTIRAGVLSLLSIGLGWVAGLVLFLWLFRPRPPAAGDGP